MEVITYTCQQYMAVCKITNSEIVLITYNFTNYSNDDYDMVADDLLI